MFSGECMPGVHIDVIADAKAKLYQMFGAGDHYTP